MRTGVLLCRVGGLRLAIPAQDVVAIEAAVQPLGVPAPQPGASAGGRRQLVAAGGQRVGVDGVELEAEVEATLALPWVLSPLAGGSLRGFVKVRGGLWPLVALAPLGRHLDAAGAQRQGAP